MAFADKGGMVMAPPFGAFTDTLIVSSYHTRTMDILQKPEVDPIFKAVKTWRGINVFSQNMHLKVSNCTRIMCLTD